MLGGYVEALALVYGRVVEAKGRIKRHDDVRLCLLQIGEVDAAVALTSEINELERDLAYLEAALIAMTAKVSQAFNAVVAKRPPEPPLRVRASYRETIVSPAKPCHHQEALSSQTGRLAQSRAP